MVSEAKTRGTIMSTQMNMFNLRFQDQDYKIRVFKAIKVASLEHHNVRPPPSSLDFKRRP